MLLQLLVRQTILSVHQFQQRVQQHRLHSAGGALLPHRLHQERQLQTEAGN